MRGTRLLAEHRVTCTWDTAGEVNRRLTMATALSSGVLGTLAGLLAALERYGSRNRQEVMVPAIRLAEQGFTLNEDMAQQILQQVLSTADFPASIAVFSASGTPYSAGDLRAQPDLATTL